MRGRILIVDHRTPRPDEDSGSASTFSYLQILSRAGFDVTFAPINLANDGRYTRALNDLGVKTLSTPEWTSIGAVIETLAPHCDFLMLYRAPVAATVFHHARQVAPAARILLHAVDLHFLRMERAAALSADPDHARDAAAMRATELSLIAQADASIVVSSYEHDLLRQLLPEATVFQIPILREPPRRPFLSAIHWSFRRLCHHAGPSGRWLNRQDRAFRRRRDLIFIGGYEHLPNVDAVRWFADHVWPILQASGFPHRFVIVGSKIPEEVAALASDGIEVRGYVDDLARMFASCRLSVAPLRYGSGIKGKIVTSLSNGVPVVATSLAIEGMGLRNGENVLAADQPELMAKQIMKLYTDADLWQRISMNGFQFFENNFSLRSGEQKVLSIMDGLVASARRK